MENNTEYKQGDRVWFPTYGREDRIVSGVIESVIDTVCAIDGSLVLYEILPDEKFGNFTTCFRTPKELSDKPTDK